MSILVGEEGNTLKSKPIYYWISIDKGTNPNLVFNVVLEYLNKP